MLWGALGVLALAALWELYKLVGPADGWLLGAQEGVTGSGFRLLPHQRPGDAAHVEMFARIVEPVTRAPGSLPLGAVVLLAALVSGVAALGWLVGVIVGFALALLMLGFRIAERAVLPFVILSQTVPLIALAPLIRNWGSRLEFGAFSSWMSVVIIASYLAFFPVAVGALRGLQSPDAAHLDLMRYAAGWWTTLFRLRLPASVPFLVPALRLAAANGRGRRDGRRGDLGRVHGRHRPAHPPDRRRRRRAIRPSPGRRSSGPCCSASSPPASSPSSPPSSAPSADGDRP